MRGTRLALIVVAGMCLVGAGTAYAVIGSPSAVKRLKTDPGLADQSASGNALVSDAQGFTDFPTYFGGTWMTAGGTSLPFSGVQRNVGSSQDPQETTGEDYWSYFYGHCNAVGDGECTTAVEIQNWNICQRWPSMYGLSPDESTTVRGVPANFYENWTRLELYTGRVAVVVFGSDRSQLLDIAQALKPMRGGITTQNLPVPAIGAMDGNLACQAH